MQSNTECHRSKDLRNVAEAGHKPGNRKEFKMTVKELAIVSPQCFIFIRKKDGTVEEYKWGDNENGKREIMDIIAINYPMYKMVLEVKVSPQM